MVKKLIFFINKVFLFIMFIFSIFLSFWVFFSTYESIKDLKIADSTPGYKLAFPMTDDWKIIRNVGLVLFVPGVVISIISAIFLLRQKRPYRGTLSCLMWVAVFVMFIFSFAIGALLIDLLLMGRKI